MSLEKYYFHKRRSFLKFLLLSFLANNFLSGCDNDSSRVGNHTRDIQFINPVNQANSVDGNNTDQISSPTNLQTFDNPNIREQQKLDIEKQLTQEISFKIREIINNPNIYFTKEEAKNFVAFRKMVDNTYPGISLSYFNNPFILNLREKLKNPDNFENVINYLIAGLFVEKSPRYNRDGLYSCNIYAQDFIRALLGNNYFGDRYDKTTGKPVSIGINDINWSNENEIRYYNERYPFFNSNIIDWWLKNYGSKYGWNKINNISNLPNFSIGIYCTPERIVRENIIRDPNFAGHMGCIFRYKNFLARTQATNHVLFEILEPSHRLINSINKNEFNVYFCYLPY